MMDNLSIIGWASGTYVQALSGPLQCRSSASPPSPRGLSGPLQCRCLSLQDWPSGAPYDQRAMAASAQYSVTVRVELDARQEPLGKLTAQIAEAGGSLVSVDLIPGAGPEGKRVREFTIDANSAEHWEQILRSIGSTRGARGLGLPHRPLEMHKKGKNQQHNKYPPKTPRDPPNDYTP